MEASQHTYRRPVDGISRTWPPELFPPEISCETQSTLRVTTNTVEKAFMQTRDNFRRSLESLVLKLSPPRMSVRLTRTLAIEFANHFLSDVKYNDNQGHNFSHNLVLGALKDGCISAKITLNNLPQGSTVLRVRSGHLEIIVSRDDASAPCDRHRLVATSHGVIDLPVYVNAASLRFFVDETTNLLYMVGETKGSNSPPSVDGSHQCTGRRSTWSAERPKVAAYKATVK